MARVSESLGELVPRDFNALLAQFEKCGECQRCMSVCPICSVDFPQREEDGSYPPQAIMRWLVSCAGCGMCEQACAYHLPLSAIFGNIREKLREELGYTAGDWNSTLPL
jgi:Fe-S oxidoreductase